MKVLFLKQEQLHLNTQQPQNNTVSYVALFDCSIHRTIFDGETETVNGSFFILDIQSAGYILAKTSVWCGASNKYFSHEKVCQYGLSKVSLFSRLSSFRVCTPAESDWVSHWCLTLSLTNVHTIYLIKNIVKVWALLPRNRHFFNRWTRSDSFSSFFTHYFVQHIILYSLWHKRYNLLNSQVFWFVFYPTHAKISIMTCHVWLGFTPDAFFLFLNIKVFL